MTPVTPRVIGRLPGPEPGPSLVVVAAIHGNEPAGLVATGRVLSALPEMALEIRGDVTFLAGNRGAVDAGLRFLDRDLNRGWTASRIESLRERRPEGGAREDSEQLELASEIARAHSRARGRRFFLDLHTTSSPGIPFAMIQDVPDQVDFAAGFDLPVIIGLLERIDGSLLEHMRTRGYTCLGIEGGQNDSVESATHHEAVLWIALVETGILSASRVPGLDRWRTILSNARGNLPVVTRITHRHPVAPEDRFRMEPGFLNLQRVRTGELLARDRNGDIRARENGLLLMPLYQRLGDDGFFLGRECDTKGNVLSD